MDSKTQIPVVEVQPETSPEEAELLRDLKRMVKEHPGGPVLRELFHRHLVRALNTALELNSHEYEKGIFDGMVRTMNLLDMACADAIPNWEARIKALPSEIIRKIEF